MKIRLIAIGCVLAAFVAVSFYLFTRGSDDQSVDEPNVDSVRVRLIEQIRRDADSGWIPPKAEPAPIVVETLPENESLQAPHSRRDFVLNDSYTVVPDPLEMTKIEMAASDGQDRKSAPMYAWLEAEHGIDRLVDQAKRADRSWTYGWLQLAHPVSSIDIENAISQHGGNLLSKDGKFLRVEFPQNRTLLEKIANLPWVAGVGATPLEEKLPEEFLSEINESVPTDVVPVFITVMSTNQPVRWRSSLEQLGVEVGRLDSTIRVYEAIVAYRDIFDVLAKDFVQAIEPIGIARISHDSAVPAMGTDVLRLVGNTAGSYSGTIGSTVGVGVMDTGLNTNHVAISTKRQSICGANFVSGEDHDLWVDEGLHGTHVTGTIAGNGFNQPRYAGMAPGIEHLRFAKVLSTGGFGSFDDISQGMDFLATASACPDAGWSNDAVKPLIVNMSLSGASLRWEGRSTGPRKLDSLVWGEQQLYVVSNSNRNIHGFSNYASAKNSLAVGAAYDSGDLARFSSIGPTSDGRLIPHIVGTGVAVSSAEGNNSRDGYLSYDGTSMSSPSVAGVAALLMDASPKHREKPALVRARLLASAIKPDAWIQSTNAFPNNNNDGPGSLQNQFGLGKVSARTSVLNRDDEKGWVSGSASVEITNEEYAYVDIEIPEDAKRVDIVMTWDEPPTDTISRAVLNNLDLWVDQGADCNAGPCGEHSSESRIDNLEWFVISNPSAGSYRIKIVPQGIYTQPPRAAVAWTIIRGDSVPELAIETAQQVFENSTRAQHEIELWVSSSSYVAAGTRLHVDCRTYADNSCGTIYSKNNRIFQRWRHEAVVEREDGIAVETEKDIYVSLGEIAEGERQRVLLNLTVDESDEPAQILFTATSWNGKAGRASVSFLPEGNMDELAEEAEVQPNDDFLAPMKLVGSEGVLEIDTLMSSSEDGEPVLRTTGKRPAKSLWFTWTADESGMAGFSVTPTLGWSKDYVNNNEPNVDVFIGSEIAGLTRIASSIWSAQFFAEADLEYKVRISHGSGSIPLLLSWFAGERPVNDDFLHALELEGESGSVAGTNVGATLEQGELYGTLASTAWWRWTAPRDGIWSFQVEDSPNLAVTAFVGEKVDELRLVSGFLSSGGEAWFPARENEKYYIMLATPSAYVGGAKFDKLTWFEYDGSVDDGDMFENAESVGELDEGNRSVRLGTSLSVEPGEPLETGSRTRWLQWQAIAESKYTWSWDLDSVHAAAFTGNSIDELTLVASGGGDSNQSEFVLETHEDEIYWVAFGYPPDSAFAFESISYGIDVQWGRTPSHDSIDGAEQLTGVAGTVTGATDYATTELDGLDRLGQDSLWYSIVPKEGGWYRVWIEDPDAPLIVSVFRRDVETGTLELITQSRSQRLQSEGTEISFLYETGSDYLIRVGSTRPQDSISFNLKWDQRKIPNWLRYVGRFANGWRDSSGRIASLGNPRDLAFDTSGRRLYVTSTQGLTVFDRNPDSGFLALLNQHSEVPNGSFMLWDFHRSRLYIHSGCNWWTYTPSSVPVLVELQDVGESCLYGSQDGSRPLHMGQDGDFLYTHSSHVASIYTFDQLGTLNYNSDIRFERSPTYGVFPTNDGSRWYVRERDSVSIFKRGLGTGVFTSTADNLPMLHRGFSKSFNDEYLFGYDRFGYSHIDFAIYEPSNDSSSIDEIAMESFTNLNLRYCVAAAARAGSHGVDIVCNNGAFVVEYEPETSALTLQDYISNEGPQAWHTQQVDRFGNLPPRYRIDHHQDFLEASPDGRHLYLTTEQNGILIFERIGNALVDPLEVNAPRYRRFDLIQASYDQIEFGDHSVTGDCLDAGSIDIDGTTFSVTSSRWQQREVGSEWTDIPDTQQSGRLCSYKQEASYEFRLIAEIDVDGQTGMYASNFFGSRYYARLDALVVEPGKVTLDGLGITSCLAISGVILNEKIYTVDRSSWQVRENENADWDGVPDSEVIGQLCPHDPTDDREYRLIGEFVIDGNKGSYSSNVMKRAVDGS